MRAWSWLYFFLTIFIISGNFSTVNPTAAVIKSSRLSTGFLFQRTVSINQKSCSCSTAFSCACCQSVRILLRSVTKNFCVNFRYAETGLSMNISLGSNVIRHVSIIDYRAFKVCTSIPDCPYSFACIDVVELSLFPRSITICLQLDIKSKTDNWMINYSCISISTILSSQSNGSMPTTTVQSSTTNIVLNGSTSMNGMPSMGMPGNGQMQSMGMPGNGQMPSMGMPGNGQMQSMGMPGNGQMPSMGMPGNGQMQSMGMPGNGQMQSMGMPGNGQMPSMGMPGNGQMQSMGMPGNGQMQSMGMPGNGQMQSMGMPGNVQMQSMGMPGNGQMPSGIIPAKFNAGGRAPIFKRTGRVSGFFDRISSRRSRELRSVVRMLQNGLKFRGLKRDRDRRGIRNPEINKNGPSLLEEEGRLFEERKIEMEIIPKNLPNRLNHRARRDSRDRRDSSAMKMQVILRSRKNRLPRIIGSEMAKGFKTSSNFPASRSPRIVNGGTVSIPMSGPGLGNVEIMNATSSNNAFKTTSSESQMEFPPPQPLPVQPSNGVPVQQPVFVLQNQPIPLDFSMYYDNRTSSFPNRTPPGFGLVSRIGPIDQKNESIAFQRSVEELETVGPKIQLHPSSKIIETSATDLSDGKIIFPE